jgi:hypothetical protein
MDNVDELGEEIGELSARLDAATQRLLTCIRRFDQAEGWSRTGALSCAHWLSWRIGLDTATARERCRVARALGALPKIDEAFGRGELSYAKVRAITRVATPELEDRLLQFACYTTAAQLERLCRGLRQVIFTRDQPLGYTPPPEDRSVRERLLPGGMVRLELTLSPDEAALVMRAIEKAQDELRDDVSAETPVETKPPSRPSDGPTRADAAVHVANTFLAGASPAAAADRYQVIIHLDQDVMAADGEWSATLDDGTRVSAETLRRVACDTGLLATRTDATDAGPGVLDIGRRSRSIPAAIRRALWVRDRGCRFPGCLHKRFLHGHHIQHWLHGGRTSLDNLVLLCPRHHHLVHEDGFTISLADDGALVFRSPQTGHLPTHPPRPVFDDGQVAIEQWSDATGLHVSAETNRPQWDGRQPDYEHLLYLLYD